MTTLSLELALMRYFKYRVNYVVPNLSPLSGIVRFETDMISVTKSNYATG